MDPKSTKILTLLRSGALEQAEKEYFRLGLNGDKSSEDVIALGGRILKGKALEQRGKARRNFALQSAEKYSEAYKKTGGTFSGINTASMYLVAGDPAKSREIAKSVLDALKGVSPGPGIDAYYHIATVAEGELLIGNFGNAEHALADALALDPHNYEAHASTLHQFDMILETLDMPSDWLAAFRPPKILHYAGHMFGAENGSTSLEPYEIQALEKAVNDQLETESYGAAFGALAAGSDILIAEQLLNHGLELHVVQPCPDTLFADMSLTPYGESWRARFNACIQKAKTVRYVSKDPSLADELTCAFASETAKGLAILRAEQLATEAVQLLIWDGKPSAYAGGTAADAAGWQNTGRRQRVIPYSFRRARPSQDAPWHNSNRSLKAMLFADFRGFGKLTELQVPLFVQHVFGPLASRLKDQRKRLKHINTWGDGLFIVFDDVAEAAATAAALQSCFQAIDLESIGLPASLALRIGGHYGPVHEITDPLMEGGGIFGREVTIAARIEPLTAPGSIFVSEPFACALIASNCNSFRCEPLGKTMDTKDQGKLSLYSLRERTIGSTD